VRFAQATLEEATLEEATLEEATKGMQLWIDWS